MSTNEANFNHPIRRVVTGHNEHAVAVVTRDDLIEGKKAPHGPVIVPIWSTAELPPDVNSPDDKGLAQTGIANDGAIFRIVGLPPRSKSVFHRTLTLDYMFVMEGTITMTLDDGSRTELKKNEVVVQQATMHRWDNDTDEWARALFILIRSQPPEIGDKVLEADIPMKI
ncbi:Cupin domain-containing protein [Neofusicoccum parvum]|uniref:Cupin domain-containing protein n=1 Tax=Neofusicoccum parvum TaxID=310453 RepID=A0ACB5SPN9_9PEZI|nr:Cupin domain-containing protein [Neofusicoccum parvum]